MPVVKRCVIGQQTMKPPIIYLERRQALTLPDDCERISKMIGEETKRQILEREGRLPDAVIAAVGGGSNAIGMFTDFIDEPNVRLIGVEPAGKALKAVNMAHH